MTNRRRPVARRLAAIHGVDLASVPGTGPRGRVTRRDVAAAAGIALAAESAQAPSPGPVPARKPTDDAAASERTSRGGCTTQSLTKAQQVIARRMSQAKATVPEFQVQADAAMDATLALRADMKQAELPLVPSINDFVVKACALALRSHPLANGSYRDGCFDLHERVNVGIAVAAPDLLVVPTIMDADIRSLGSIAAEARRLSERVRAGTVTPPELSGATFTVSNLGMYGMRAMTPVINLPQAAILGAGAIRGELARDEAGAIVDRHVLTLTLTCDHRILYGAEAASLLGDVKALLETPLRLAL